MITLIILALLLVSAILLAVDGIWLWRRNQMYRFKRFHLLPFSWFLFWALSAYLFGWWGVALIPAIACYFIFMVHMGEL